MSTWECTQSFPVTSKFVYFPSKLFRQLVYTYQNLTGQSWEDMLSNFKDLVSVLYMGWKDCLMQSLNPAERTYFESIYLMTATEVDLTRSLHKLSYLLRRKFGRKVIVLIDEYEAPIICAYEHGYFDKVRSLHSSLRLPRLRLSNPDQLLFRARRTFSSLEGDHYEIPFQNI
jgi:hypothetical protein